MRWEDLFMSLQSEMRDGFSDLQKEISDLQKQVGRLEGKTAGWYQIGTIAVATAAVIFAWLK